MGVNAYRIVISSGPGRGKTFDLPSEGVLKVGAAKSCQIHLDGAKAKAVHCFLKCAQGRVALVVQDPDAVVHVNDKSIRKKILEPGESLRLADVTLSFEGAEDDPLVGTTLGGYRIEERLGRGGMGTVYRATQLSLDRQVALKVLSADLTKDDAFVQEFLKEARAAAKLNHPNVVQVYDALQEGQSFFFSMEFLPGGTLQELLEKKGHLPLHQAIEIGRDTALALVWAEEHGIVHRDIKPDNLLFSGEGKVKVADLGIAADLYGGKADEKSRGIGSPRYMAPEQALHQPVDHRADIYALGCTLYRMIAGKAPFDGKTKAEIIKAKTTSDAEPLEMLLPAIPSAVSELVAKMMARDPADRLSSCAELVPALEECLKLARSSGKLEEGGAGHMHEAGHFVRKKRKESEQAVSLSSYLESTEGKITLSLSAFMIICSVSWAVFWTPQAPKVDKSPRVADSGGPSDPRDDPRDDLRDDQKKPSREVDSEAPERVDDRRNGPKSTSSPPGGDGDGPPKVNNPREVALFKEVETIMERWRRGTDRLTTLAALEEFKRKHPETNFADLQIKRIRDDLKDMGASALSKHLAGKGAELLKRGDYHGAVKELDELAKSYPENLTEINAEIKRVEDTALEALKKAEADGGRAAERGDFARAVSLLKELEPMLPEKIQASVAEKIQGLNRDEKVYVEASKAFDDNMDQVLEAVNTLDFERASSLLAAMPQPKSPPFAKRRALLIEEMRRCRQAWEKLKAGVNEAIGSAEELSLAFEPDPGASAGMYRLKELQVGTLALQKGNGPRETQDVLSLTANHLLLILAKGPGGKAELAPDLIESAGLLLLHRNGPGRAKELLLDARLSAEKQENYKERLAQEEEIYLAGAVRRAASKLKHLADPTKNEGGQANLSQRWEQLALEVGRSIVGSRKLKGYSKVREELSNTFRRAKAEVLRAAAPQSLFHGKVKSFKSDRTLELVYDFASEDQKKDFVSVRDSSLMEIDSKTAKLMGEFRLCKGDVFKSRLSVAGKALLGYNPDKPNINVAFWTHDNDRVTPKSRPKKPVEEDPEAASKPFGPPLDYLVFAIGYRGPVLDRRLEEHEQLLQRGSGVIVQMPANALLGGYRGKPLHTAPEEECFWAQNVQSKIKGSQDFRIALAPGSFTWTVNTRPIITLKDLKGVDITKRAEPYAGSVTFFTNGEVVVYDSITVIGELSGDWENEQLLKLATKELKKFEPDFPFKPSDEEEWQKLLEGGGKK